MNFPWWQALKQMNYSQKKISDFARERSEIQCHAFMNMIADIAPEPTMLMFTDESAKDEWTQNCHHGWSRKNT